MDEIVSQSLKKWPNVPHCYGWLGLDARGHWRMRDQHAQDHDLPGDKIAHTALLGFINRNVDVDTAGRWYFQNGPQRVYINLEIAPFIAHTDPQHGLLLHTGGRLPPIEAVYLTPAGRLLLQFVLQFGGAHGATIAALDDRDLAQCLPALQSGGAPLGETGLLAWLDGAEDQLTWCFEWPQQAEPKPLTVQRIDDADIAQKFKFVLRPQPDSAD